METKVDKKLQKRWLTALVSRKYKQGRSCLRTLDNKFCCYGVLLDLINNAEWISNIDEYSTPDEYSFHPPHNVLDKIGINRNDVCIFSDMNDDGYKFYQIARRLKTYFKNHNLKTSKKKS